MWVRNTFHFASVSKLISGRNEFSAFSPKKKNETSLVLLYSCAAHEDIFQRRMLQIEEEEKKIVKTNLRTPKLEYSKFYVGSLFYDSIKVNILYINRAPNDLRYFTLSGSMKMHKSPKWDSTSGAIIRMVWGILNKLQELARESHWKTKDFVLG